MDKRHGNYMQCNLNHVYSQLVQTLFFIEINPNAIYKYCTQTSSEYNDKLQLYFIENSMYTNIKKT